jgi:hypothetical protein
LNSRDSPGFKVSFINSLALFMFRDDEFEGQGLNPRWPSNSELQAFNTMAISAKHQQ